MKPEIFLKGKLCLSQTIVTAPARLVDPDLKLLAQNCDMDYRHGFAHGRVEEEAPVHGSSPVLWMRGAEVWKFLP